MSTSVFIEGNLTRDPELSFLNNGMALTKFGLAETYRVRGKNGMEDKEITSFYDVAVFGKMAENAAETLRRGMAVGVQGRLEVRKYEKNDGTDGFAAEVSANFVGPGLRFATALVNKNPRNASPSAPQQGAYSLPAEEPF